jgi:glycosyltransferase involved in cell wall biosynthesis
LAGFDRRTQIYPSVNLDVFKPRPTPRADGNLRVLFNGKATWEKGFPFVVSAAGELPDVDFYVRTTPIRVPNDFPPNIHIVPPMPYHTLPELYQSVDVLIHPANSIRIPYWEQWGNIHLEALASGLYIVSTTNGSIPEILCGAEATILRHDTVNQTLTQTLRDIRDGKIDITGATITNRALAERRFNPMTNCARYAEVVKMVVEG